MFQREEVRSDTYQGFVFLEPNLLLLPNAKEKEFEAIELPELSDTKFQATNSTNAEGINTDIDLKFRRIARLGLPQLRFSDVIAITSRSDPSPFGAVHPKCASGEWQNGRGRDRMFTSDPAKALVLMQLLLNDDAMGAWARLNFVAPRDKVIEAIRRHTIDLGASRPQSWVQYVPDHEMHRNTDVDDNSLDGDNTRLVPNSTLGEGEFDDNGSKDCLYIPWRLWGSDATRWCIGSESHSVWITTTAGERFIGLRTMGNYLVMKDFNPYHVREVRKKLEATMKHKQVENEAPNLSESVVVPEDGVPDGAVDVDDEGEALVDGTEEVGLPVMQEPGEMEGHLDDDENEDDGNEDEDRSEDEEDIAFLKPDDRTIVRLVDARDSASRYNLSLVFEDAVDWDELPYVEIGKRLSPDIVDLRGALIDEDRIIGLKVSSRGWKGKERY